jgi:hypothetical protein
VPVSNAWSTNYWANSKVFKSSRPPLILDPFPAGSETDSAGK